IILLVPGPGSFGILKSSSPDETATATYCLPFLPWYVIGVLTALFGNSVDHNSLPVLESKARNILSEVAPMNTRPPPVTIRPPALGVPVLGIPRAVSSLYSPSGTRQAMLPVLASTAISSPQGGAEQG